MGALACTCGGRKFGVKCYCTWRRNPAPAVKTRAQWEAAQKRIAATVAWYAANRCAPDGGLLTVDRATRFEDYDLTPAPRRVRQSANGATADPLAAVKSACLDVRKAEARRIELITAARASGLTLAAIATAAGVTRERIRQLTTAAQ